MRYKRATKGINDLKSRYPQIYSELHPELNNFIDTEMITYGARMKLWWVCRNNHTYSLTPNQRTSQKQGCNFCSGHKVLKGFNDLATTNPEYIVEWSKENTLSIDEVSYGSHEPILWVCSLGHEWIISPNQRTSYSTGCPICSGNEVLIGFNDLESQDPYLASQWDHTKNSVKPYEVTTGSTYKANWKCSKGHEWSAVVSSRARGGRGCWSCVERTSIAEDYIAQVLEDSGYRLVRNSRSILSGKELDIYIPDERLAIEFNGIYWHSTKSGKDPDDHYNKWKSCKEIGIDLIHIWEFEYEENPNQYIQKILDLLSRKFETDVCIVENGSLEEVYYSRENVGLVDFEPPLGVVYNLNRRRILLPEDTTLNNVTVYNAGYSKRLESNED